MIVFAAIAPHGGPVFDDPEGPTRQGMEELARRFTAASPESVIVVTPHGTLLDDHFGVVRSARLSEHVSPFVADENLYEGPGEPELADATGERRVAFIASADHGHGHTPDGPYGFAPESAEYDEEIQRVVRDNRLAALAGWDPGFAVAAKADSFWQLLMLHGALGDGFDAELLSYEAPTYFGMLTASFRPRK